MDSTNLSIRVTLASPSRDAGDAAARAAALATPNEPMRKAISLGLQKLALRAQKERFSGEGPFAVAQNRLGVVSGRLRRDLHAEPSEILGNGYSGRIGAAVEYFAAHEVGFSGTVQVKAYTRDAYTVKRQERTRTSRKGKQFSVRANQFSVLSGSVRAHSKQMRIPARKPLRTAIEQHGPTIMGEAIRKGVKAYA